MARIFITGSADGLGQLTATALAAQRHEVVLHAQVARVLRPGGIYHFNCANPFFIGRYAGRKI